MTLAEIEKATLRLVAIEMSSNLSRAAERLGMAPVSLTRWVGRRKLPPALARRYDDPRVAGPRWELDAELEASFDEEEAGLVASLTVSGALGRIG